MSDANLIMAAEEASRTDHHWLVAFAVKLHPSVVAEMKKDGVHKCSECGEEEEDDNVLQTVATTFTVGCGPNGEDACARVKAYVLDPEKFGAQVLPETYRLQGLQLKSVQEI